MKIEILTIKCDNCGGIIFHRQDGKIIGNDDNVIFAKLEKNNESVSSTICSLQCFIMSAWNKLGGGQRTDIDLVSDLKKTFPLWDFVSPNYKSIYETKILDEIKCKLEREGMSNFEIIKKDKN